MTLKTIGIFVLGVATGVAGSYYFLKKAFDKELAVEVESVKMVYGKRHGTTYEEAEKAYHKSQDKAPTVEAVPQTDYTAFFPKGDFPSNPPLNDIPVSTGEVGVKNENGEWTLPYIIKEDEFGAEEDYNIYNLLFNVKTFECIDLLDNRQLNATDILGSEVFDHLDDPAVLEEDTIYVVDEIRKTYYEIELVRPEEGDN